LAPVQRIIAAKRMPIPITKAVFLQLPDGESIKLLTTLFSIYPIDLQGLLWL